MATMIAKPTTKVILAVLFFGCFYKMPEVFYVVLSYISIIAFSIIFYFDYKNRFYLSLLASVPCVVLLNPLSILSFETEFWLSIYRSLVYVFMALSLIEWMHRFFYIRKKKERFKNMNLTFDHSYYLY